MMQWLGMRISAASSLVFKKEQIHTRGSSGEVCRNHSGRDGFERSTTEGEIHLLWQK